MSLRLKIFLAFSSIVLLTIAIVVLVARQGTVREVRAFMVRGGMVGASGLVEQLEEYFSTHGNWGGVENLLIDSGQGQRRGAGMPSMMYQRLILANAKGRIVVDTSNQSTGQNIGADAKSQAVQLRSEGRLVGYLVALGGMNSGLREETNLVNRLNRVAWFTGLIAGGLALLLAAAFSYQLLRPVQELTRAAETLSRGDLSQRVEVRGEDELARLAATFNSMADSLQRAETERRALTADIAHELRNPLAVQRANLEALQDGLYPLTAENLQPILEQNILLTRLVEDLRTLALAESGQLKLELTPTDLPALVRRAAEHFEPQAAARQIRLQFIDQIDPSNPLPLLTLDPMRIDQILSNLLSNALRLTPNGGSVSLELSRIPYAACVTVRDSGPGIPPEALPHVFERFYRADRSRSRSEGGTGLGLAIARQLAETQHGSLIAQNHPEGGAMFTLTLPLPPEGAIVSPSSNSG
jgi:signal transduction histidine kinase